MKTRVGTHPVESRDEATNLAADANPFAAAKQRAREGKRVSTNGLGFERVQEVGASELVYLSASGAKGREWVGAKRSRERLSDLRLSFFNDCGSTGSPPAPAAAIAIAADLRDSSLLPSLVLSRCWKAVRNVGLDKKRAGLTSKLPQMFVSGPPNWAATTLVVLVSHRIHFL